MGPPLPCTAFRLEAVPEMNYDPCRPNHTVSDNLPCLRLQVLDLINCNSHVLLPVPLRFLCEPDCVLPKSCLTGKWQ